ncbi:MAG: histidine kinase [Oscillospiraceae bacterium]|nr:histidine kinase [Oscillospiraceae bacterium]
MKREKQPGSLREKLVGITLACWVLPIMIVVALAAVLLNANYERNVREQLETDAAYALQGVENRLNGAFDASKAVSYDGVVRSAYREYQQSGDSVALYRSISEYLNQNFSREELFRAVFISFWDDIRIYPYVMSSGIQGYSIPRNYHRSVEPAVLEEMRDADTAIRLLIYDGELYLARNLLDSRFEPYASIVMLCDRGELFRSLDDVRRISGVALLLDDLILDEEGTLRRLEADEGERVQELSFDGKLEGHRLRMYVSIAPYNILNDMPELRIAVAAVILLVLPLLLLMILLFRRQVTRPVETLLSATDRLQGGERGYQIGEQAESREFERIFRHFNAMSEELKNQFERSWLEQQALQQARVKALQSQINPHFLNNTLEIINWEARLAGDDRVSAMIEALSVMLDAALGRDGRGEIPLREEMGYVDAYLYIIRERLGEKLTITREIDDALMETMVPRLILQPLVENAVDHDLAPNGGGQLSLRVSQADGNIVLESEHDGVMSEEDLAAIREMLASAVIDTETVSGQVGLRNVRQRLQLLYGEQGSITVEQSAPGRILARVCLPMANSAK